MMMMTAMRFPMNKKMRMKMVSLMKVSKINNWI